MEKYFLGCLLSSCPSGGVGKSLRITIWPNYNVKKVMLTFLINQMPLKGQKTGKKLNISELGLGV